MYEKKREFSEIRIEGQDRKCLSYDLLLWRDKDMFENDYSGLIEQWKLERIRTHCKRRGLQSADRDDVEQELVPKIAKLKETYPNVSGEEEKRLIDGVIRNFITDFKRKKKLREMERLDLSIHDQAVNTEDAVDLRIDLEMTFEKMPRRLREVWTLLMSGYTYKEGAKILHISKDTFEKDVQRLREALAPIYRDYFGGG